MNSLHSQTTPKINVHSSERPLASKYHNQAHLKISKQTPISFNFPKSRFIAKAWKVGHYQRNSSISNSNLSRSPARSTLNLVSSNEGALSSYRSNSVTQSQNISSGVRSKSYHPNYQTAAGWRPQQSSGSMMNYQTLNYDPITHVSREPRVAVASHRQKGICEFYEQAKLYNNQLNPSYQAALTQDKTTFHKGGGEFSQYVSLSVKYSREGPFRVSPTLLKNK